MPRIVFSLVFFTVLTALLWAIAAMPDLAAAQSFLQWRNNGVQFSGVLAIALFSLCMILGARPAVLEGPLGGLDKMYRLHKWSAIAGLVFAGLHWLASKAPKWLVKLGVIERGQRPPRETFDSPVYQILAPLRGFAEDVGEQALYAAIALIAIALLKFIPYRWFQKTHRFIAAVYLVLVFHTIVLLKFDDWATPFGALMALLLAAGSVAAFLSLTGRIGRGRRARGTIENIAYFDGVRVSAVTIALDTPWPGHREGQFAFVTFDPKEGPHPFSIASAWEGDGKITFLIKQLGDYTRTLPRALKIGEAATVEGPYGRFTFEETARPQIWIGAGIGVAPFVSRMQALASEKDRTPVTFYHTTRDIDEDALARLKKDAQDAGIDAKIVIDSRDGLLTAARIEEENPDWRDADIWFCGPAAFGDTLRAALEKAGMRSGAFRQEMFELR